MSRNIQSINTLKELPKGEGVTFLSAYNDDGSIRHVMQVLPDQICTTGLPNLVAITAEEYAQALADMAPELPEDEVPNED